MATIDPQSMRQPPVGENEAMFGRMIDGNLVVPTLAQAKALSSSGTLR